MAGRPAGRAAPRNRARGRLVIAAISGGGDRDATTTPEPDDPHGWIADVDALLAERACAAEPAPLDLPAQLSVSALVELDRDRRVALRRLTRRLPVRRTRHALLGTAFHDWVQRFYGRRAALRPRRPARRRGSAERRRRTAAKLQDAFSASPWAPEPRSTSRVPFELVLGDTVVRGRIDAVFSNPDGGVTVVDWKTGEPPPTRRADATPRFSFAVYRLGLGGLAGCPAERVRAASPLRAFRADGGPGRAFTAQRNFAAILQPRRGALRRIASAPVTIGICRGAAPATPPARATACPTTSAPC